VTFLGGAVLKAVPRDSAFRHGILRNPLYGGTQIWNRVRMVRTATGKMISRVNPPSDWHNPDMPHLRIVDKSLFDRV